ncbi:hypothetical protein KAI92_02765 [Candidatus Parcubacteria bacterium]|nr:hypothetical protein [Candidatus Parcubacteria bacterium]
MKKNNLKKIITSFLIFMFSVSSVSASVFNHNDIITDSEMLDSSTMTLAEIETFLRAKGGHIASLRTNNSDGHLKTVAQIIYDAANNYDCSKAENLSDKPTRDEKAKKCVPITINPKVLLVLLQKEQGLLTDKTPKQSQLDWALGYGCPDNEAPDPRWKGFGKQLNSASLQFYDYIKSPNNYPYEKGKTYTVTNTGHLDSIVTPVNNATAALYNYTPHVYWGNFNFHKFWNSYFSMNFPNGTLVQIRGEAGVWLIQNGVKRPFHTKGALTSRFDLNKIVKVNKSDLDNYTKGSPIKFPQYSLIRSPRGTIYLLVDDVRRGITSGEVFKKIGYNPEEIINASWADVNAYTEGKPITEESSYPTGALLQDKETGGVYWVEDETKAPLWDAVLLKTKFKYNAIAPVESEKLNSYKTIAPVKFNDGELLTPNNSPGVYVIDGGKKRAITSAEIFENRGYKWENIIIVSPKIMNLYEEGEPLSGMFNQSEDNTELAKAEETVKASSN